MASQTEKLLLYGGAIHEAGEVKARRAAKHATSDWMELEKQRGTWAMGARVPGEGLPYPVYHDTDSEVRNRRL